jgi:opacity protein-like surface antigen
MKCLALLAAAAAIFSSQAFAADLPVKASPYLSYPTGNGWFWGVSASGFGGTVANSNAPNGTLFGAKAGIDFGYTGTIANTMYFVEQNFSAQAVSGSPTLISASFSMEQRLAVGVPPALFQQWLQLTGLNSVSMPTVGGVMPPGTVLTTSAPYASIQLYEDDVSLQLGNLTGKSWLFSYGVGAGILNRLNNGWVLDTSIEWKHAAAGILIGSAPVIANSRPFDDAFLGTIRVKF